MTGPRVIVSRATNTIIVTKAKGAMNLEDLVNFRDALGELAGYIKTFEISGVQLYIEVNRTLLPSDDPEGTMVALEEQVGVVAHDTLGG